MSALYLQCKPPAFGYDEDDILKAVNKLTHNDQADFYNLLARSTSPMPFSECLAHVGLNTSCEQVERQTADQLFEQSEWLK